MARPPSVVIAVLMVGLVGAAPPGCAPEDKPDIVAGEGGRWEALRPLGGGARQETAVVTLRGEIVVLGGFNDLGGVVRDVEAYDPTADAWRRLADLPDPLHHANAAVVDERIVVAGFLVGADFQRDGRVFVYDPDADSWTSGSAMPASTRGAAGVAALDGKLYVFGGLEGGSSARASRYDPGNDSWEELPDLPLPLDHLAAGAIAGMIYVVGGRTNGLQNVAARAFAFDPASLTWSERAPMPTARAGFAAAVLDDELVVVGGEGNAGDDSGVFPQVEAYDPVSDVWKPLVAMRTPRHGMGAATVDGAVYVPGGADRQGFAAVDVHERFVPAASAPGE